MPTDTLSADSSDSPYPRENHFANTGAGDPQPDNDRDWGTYHQFGPRHDYDEKFAFDMLRESGTMLCGEALVEQDVSQELTPPSIRPPAETASQNRHRKRYNPESGAITGGEGTWCELEPRSAQKFLGVVDESLGYLNVQPGSADPARRTAKRLKHHPEGPGDHGILTLTVKVAKGKIDEDEAMSRGIGA